MSGPKYSSAVIERRRLLILKAQLEAEIEHKKCIQITSNINTCIDNCNDFISRMDINRYRELISTADKIVKNKTLINEVTNHINELQKLINTSYDINGNSEKLYEIFNLYEKRTKRIKNKKIQIEELLKQLNILFNEQQEENRENEFRNTEWENVQKILNISQTVLHTYNEIIEKLLDCDDFENEKIKYDNILNNHLIDDSFKISQMKMYFDSYMLEKQAISDNEEMLKLNNEYIVLSNQLYGFCEYVPKDKETLMVSISAMLDELQKKAEGEYIAESINRVMTKLGYSILSQEILKEQKMQKQHFDYSSNSAITVASSDKGAMMLEVVGKQTETGINNPTVIKNDMERFCPDYAKIKEELKQYGIILNDKKICPPDEKYVRFVDFDKNSDRRIQSQNRKKRMQNE